MYKVFVNEAPLILTDETPTSSKDSIFTLDDDGIMKAIESLSKKRLKKAYLVHSKQDQLLERFIRKIPLVVAAGGLVTNPKGKVLFIYRNDKWDLPKGKLEKGESIEEAALREVEEETGIGGLKIDNFLKITYHVFKRNGVFKLKQVHWFAMTTSFTGKGEGQAEEGITRVKWKGPKKTKKALKKSYKTIKILFQD